MDEFEQSDVGKEKNDSHNTFCQNLIHIKAIENAFIKKIKLWYIFSCVCYKTKGRCD